MRADPWTGKACPHTGFSLFELLPCLRGLRFGSRHLILGGILSGFFGGLSGHQGALRSAFLAKAGVTTSAFVGTNPVIGFLVDMARIAMYAAMFVMAETAFPIGPDQWPLIATGKIAAFAGIMIGKRYLHKNYHERSPDTCGYFTAWDRYASCDGLNLVKSASRN